MIIYYDALRSISERMLRKFSVQNYKNFRNKIVLDFTNTRDYRYNEECIKNGLLNKALIMGYNASGKTNLGYALFDIVYTLTDKLSHESQRDKGSFINGMSNSPEAVFRYEFQHGDRIVSYEYRKTEPFVITYECLKIDDNIIFEFDYHTGLRDVRGLKDYNAGSLDTEPLDGSMAVLKYVARSTPQAEDSPIRFVVDFAGRMLYFRSAHDGNKFIGFFDRSELMDQFIINNDLVEDFQRFLRDQGRIDIALGVESNSFQKILVQRFKYKTIPFDVNKSSGTHSLELLYYWSKCFDRISFLFIDEFDAYYHFKLAEDIVSYTIGNVDVQTVFTSHNSGLVDNGIMRPDCYLQLKDGKLTALVDLTTRELREAHNLEKMLHNGEFDG